MPAANVEFHRLARKDYDEAYEWYLVRSPDAALKFKQAVDEAIARIAEQTTSLPAYSGLYHWARVTRFPYIVVFRPRDSSNIVIVAVAHTSRRPRYWSRRS